MDVEEVVVRLAVVVGMVMVMMVVVVLVVVVVVDQVAVVRMVMAVVMVIVVVVMVRLMAAGRVITRRELRVSSRGIKRKVHSLQCCHKTIKLPALEYDIWKSLTLMRVTVWLAM